MKAKIEVDYTALEKAKSSAKQLEQQLKKGFKVKVRLDDTDIKDAKKQIQSLGKSKTKVDVDVDDSKIKKASKELDSMSKKKIKVPVDSTDVDKFNNKLGNTAKTGQSAVSSISSGFTKLGGVLTSTGSMLNALSAGLQNVGNNMQMIGRFGLIGSSIVGGGLVGGLVALTKAGITSASSIEKVQYQLQSQGLTTEEATDKLAELS